MRTIQDVGRLDAGKQKLDLAGVLEIIRCQIPELHNEEALLGADANAHNGISDVRGDFAQHGASSIMLECVECVRDNLDTISAAVDIVLVLPQRRVVSLVPLGFGCIGLRNTPHQKVHAQRKLVFDVLESTPHFGKRRERTEELVGPRVPLIVVGRVVIERPRNAGRKSVNTTRCGGSIHLTERKEGRTDNKTYGKKQKE